MNDLEGPGDQPVARIVEADDEDFQLPDGRTSWFVSLTILLLSGVVVFGLVVMELPKIPIAGFVLVASFVAPFVAGVRGHISMDRVVPFAGMLALLAVVYFNTILSVASDGDFFPWRGNPQGPLLYLMAFGGVPTASVIGGVLGCVIDRKRRGSEDDDHLMM